MFLGVRVGRVSSLVDSAVVLAQQGSLLAGLASLRDSIAQLTACDGTETSRNNSICTFTGIRRVWKNAGAYLLLTSEGVGLALRESFTRSLESFAGSKKTPRFRRGISSTSAWREAFPTSLINTMEASGSSDLLAVDVLTADSGASLGVDWLAMT